MEVSVRFGAIDPGSRARSGLQDSPVSPHGRMAVAAFEGNDYVSAEHIRPSPGNPPAANFLSPHSSSFIHSSCSSLLERFMFFERDAFQTLV